MLREALEEAGFPHVLHVVNDGNAAMDFLRERARGGGVAALDLLILDLNLPGKNGRQVMAEMQGNQPWRACRWRCSARRKAKTKLPVIFHASAAHSQPRRRISDNSSR